MIAPPDLPVDSKQFTLMEAQPIMIPGTARSSSPEHLKLAIRGREDCIGIRRAFAIDQNFGVPQHARSDDAVFRMRDMNTIVSLEQGLSYPADVAIACQIEIFVVVGTSVPGIPLTGACPPISAYGVAVNFVTPTSDDSPTAPLCAPMTCVTACSTLVPASDFECENNLLWLDLNHRPAREATLEEMTWPISEVLSRITRRLPMQQGDLVFTGPTQPALPVKPSDILRGGVEGLTRFCLRIGSSARDRNVWIASTATGTAMRSGRGR